MTSSLTLSVGSLTCNLKYSSCQIGLCSLSMVSAGPKTGSIGEKYGKHSLGDFWIESLSLHIYRKDKLESSGELFRSILILICHFSLLTVHGPTALTASTLTTSTPLTTSTRVTTSTCVQNRFLQSGGATFPEVMLMQALLPRRERSRSTSGMVCHISPRRISQKVLEDLPEESVPGRSGKSSRRSCSRERLASLFTHVRLAATAVPDRRDRCARGDDIAVHDAT